jgi:hypothetical protein
MLGDMAHLPDFASTPGSVRRLWSRLREANAAQVELWERLWLLNHPWEEEYLHWTPDGQLHGTLTPPPGRGRPSVTTDGWCLGLADRDRMPQSPRGRGRD